MHIRGRIRRAVRDAVTASPELAGTTVLKSWAQPVSTDELPALGVFTPRETSSPIDTTDVERGTDVMVLLKRQGSDDIEDLLDDDSAAIEALVLPILEGFGNNYQLQSTDMDVSGEGSARVGKLDMVFRVSRFTAEGQPE